MRRLLIGGAVTLALLLVAGAALAAPTYVDRLTRPKVINGDLTLPFNETVDNLTDDIICFEGQAGADDTDLCFDLDGASPTIYSATDTTVTVSDILAATGGVSIGGAFAFTGTTWGLAPTGAYTLDMDAAQAITITTADMASAYIVQAAGGEDLILLDYSVGSKKINLGNATDNPALSVLGSGQITLAGNVDASAGVDVTGATTSDTLAVGGGYGATGCSISAAGAIECDGAITSDGTVTGGTLTDGTATITAGAAAGLTTIGSSGPATLDSAGGGSSFGGGLNVTGTVVGGTITDGTAGFTAGALTGATTLTNSGAATFDTGAAGSSFGGALGVTGILTATATADFDAGLTITAGQTVDTSAAGDFGIGTATATSVTVGTGLGTFALDTANIDVSALGAISGATGIASTGTIAFDAGEIDETEIADITRTVTLPLSGAQECTDGGAIDWASGADTYPDYELGSGGATAGSMVLQWDIVGGQLDIDPSCWTLTVPQDYVGDSTFHVTMLDTATNDHEYTVTTLVQTPGVAEDVATATPTTGNGTNGTTTTTTCDGGALGGTLYTCTFTTEAVTAGATILFAFASDGTSTEATTVLGAEWQYTAAQ